jgi:signal transduction histidine kinase
MQTERHRSAARWQSLKAELARTRADLATATAQIEDADTRTETLEASNLELAEARDDADTANRAKSEFLAAAGHDLRQPLQAMSALQGLLAAAARDTGSKALIARLDTSLQAIATLLDTLLDEDRIEDGIAQIDVHPVPLEALFATLAEAHGPAAEAAGIGLTFAPTHARVESDPVLLQQMVSNLIGNALRFTPHGKVLVGARGVTVQGVVEQRRGICAAEFGEGHIVHIDSHGRGGKRQAEDAG